MKKILAFDLDGTLAPSKSTLPDAMARVLVSLLDYFEICVISGAKYELIVRQVLNNLPASKQQLAKLHLMPTSGTRYYTYNLKKDDWDLRYADDFTLEDKKQIIKALVEGLKESGYKAAKTYGETIEDRESQITLSILGQDIVDHLGDKGVEIKEAWDPDGSKKMQIRDIVAAKIPDFEVRAAGATSIDITKPGIDKAYGMHKLIEYTGLSKEDILFFGDKIVEGGNDYPVKAMGIDSLQVNSPEDTVRTLQGILHVVSK